MHKRYYRRRKKYKYRKGQDSRDIVARLLALVFLSLILFQLIKTYQTTTQDTDTIINITGIVVIVSLFIRVAYKLYKKKKYLSSEMYLVDRMSGIEFERFLKTLFESLGYTVRLTPPSGDYGVDLICEKESKGYFSRDKIVIQAKRYKGWVGIAAVQQIVGGMHYYNCSYGMVVTNSRFSSNAKNLARKSNVVLWDRKMLKKQLKRTEKERTKYKKGK